MSLFTIKIHKVIGNYLMQRMEFGSMPILLSNSIWLKSDCLDLLHFKYTTRSDMAKLQSKLRKSYDLISIKKK